MSLPFKPMQAEMMDCCPCGTPIVAGDSIVVLPKGIDENGAWPKMMFCFTCGQALMAGPGVLRRHADLAEIGQGGYIEA